MALILSKEAEEAWLSDRPVGDFAFPHYNPELVALNLNAGNPTTLF